MTSTAHGVPVPKHVQPDTTSVAKPKLVYDAGRQHLSREKSSPNWLRSMAGGSFERGFRRNELELPRDDDTECDTGSMGFGTESCRILKIVHAGRPTAELRNSVRNSRLAILFSP